MPSQKTSPPVARARATSTPARGFPLDGPGARRRLRALRSKLPLALLLASLLLPHAPSSARQKKIGKSDIERGRKMLKTVKKLIEANYYDPNFHGVDLEARFGEGDELIRQAESHGQINGIIARTLLYFEDSHTYFIPPDKMPFVEYGWRMMMVGETCHVVDVKPGSDAEKKGLRPGDIVLAVDGMRPNRRELWKIQYLHESLRPVARVRLVVRSPGEEPREIEAKSELLQFNPNVWRYQRIETDDDGEEEKEDKKEGEEEDDERKKPKPDVKDYAAVGDDLFVWKFRSFNLYHPAELDGVMNKARKYKSLVLDLRDNGGGSERIMLRMIGYFLEQDFEVGHIVRRKEKKPLVAKSLGDRAYRGKLVVLVNSNSASASELFARAMQLRGRGVVVGDRTAGAVMRGRWYGKRAFVEVYGSDAIYFGVSVTDADIIMPDGKSLEHAGVTPDELLLPTAEDMAARRDPVLARAAELLGVKLDAQKAGAMYPTEWK
jgi:C-terminal processing protease CtpA/Prc